MVPAAASDDAAWMRKALRLARRGEGRTRPNPPVGAVVVRDGRWVGRGFHERAGGSHAEVSAIAQAGAAAQCATIYVTLEPCSTTGRTPPCTELILRSGISRVVVGVEDPNPRHGGRGLRVLREAGVSVDVGVCRRQAASLIEPFAKWIETQRPFVTLKMAMTLDGRIADGQGRSRWITGPDARRYVHRLRRAADVVMVGRGTTEADNPSLLPEGSRDHACRRLIVDSAGRLPKDLRVFTDGKADRTIVAVTSRCGERRKASFVASGAEVWRVRAAQGCVSLRDLMRKLGAEGYLHVLCEGGGTLAGGLARAGLVDRYIFFVAPRLLGGGGSVGVIGGDGWALASGPRLRFEECRRLGDDVMLSAVPADGG